MLDAIRSLPAWVRKFAVDFIETGIAALALLNLTMPHSFDEAKIVGITIGAALLGALISAARRDLLPAVLDWLKGLAA